MAKNNHSKNKRTGDTVHHIATGSYHLVASDDQIVREHFLGYHSEGQHRAKLELAHLTSNAELLTDEGSSSVVFEDGTKAYKVSRGGIGYNYIEHEAAMLQLVGGAGFAPRIRALHEPPTIYRFQNKDDALLGFNDNFPRRFNPNLTVPIIEMDFLDTPSDHPLRFDVLTRRELQGQFKHLAQFLIDNCLDSRGDTELTVDVPSRSLKFVDVGGIRYSPGLAIEKYISGAIYPLTPIQLIKNIGTLDPYDPSTLSHIQKLYARGGLDAVAELITTGSEEPRGPKWIRSIIGHLAYRSSDRHKK